MDYCAEALNFIYEINRLMDDYKNSLDVTKFNFRLVSDRYDIKYCISTDDGKSVTLYRTSSDNETESGQLIFDEIKKIDDMSDIHKLLKKYIRCIEEDVNNDYRTWLRGLGVTICL